MKRSLALISYPSSDEEDSERPGEINTVQGAIGQPKRCALLQVITTGTNIDSLVRKLPRVSPSLVIPTPKADPALHQGRIRTTPHVDGQFAAFVYISVPMKENTELRELLEQSVCAAKTLVPHLKCDWLEDKKPVLHISLTRPIYLRDHQRDDLKRAVRAVSRKHKP